MKNCELCRLPARIVCESDQAMLCWDCDAKVHGANFLVARHSRSLLCHGCQSPTPWNACGEKLGHTFSVCESCVVRDGSRDEEEEEVSQDGNDDEFDSDIDEIDDDDDADDDEGVGFDEGGDKQVVPLSSTATPPPPTSSASSSEQSATASNNGDGDGSEDATAVSLKRFRETASDLRSQVDDLHRSCPHRRCGSAKAARAGRTEPDDGATSVDSSRPRKDRRIDLNRPGSPSSPVIESTRRFRRQDNR
ncbi:zinc finger protein CONSTANS-LIKE 4-like [Pyrus communis]|uniref:zinc finger protein CONSTANS-LIKE 4-like n=1 Tax=Pyrus communis TaxID=23211 RepID=UPI0035C220C1